MKIILIILNLICGITIAQADLIMEFNTAPLEIKVAVKIKGDKIRSDSGGISRIADLRTGENFILDHGLKQIKKLPTLFDQTTNVIAERPKFEDTGKTEILSGYEAEIYKRTSFDGRAEILWVAKTYPNFGQIENDISKLDRVSDKKWMPELNSISGMPLKLVISRGNSVTNGIDASITLLSAKEEPIDDSVFELPKDYHYYTNAPSDKVSLPTSPAATNEPPAK